MSKKDMAIILGGQLLPKYGRLRKLDEPNETDNTTLGGTLYTDFKNVRRVWTITWELLTEEDFSIIYTLFRAQYDEKKYHPLQIDAYNVYEPVKMEISAEDIKWNGGFIENFTLTLREQYAIS